MENNRSSVSYPDAYRIYTGRSFASGVMWLSIGAVALFSGLMLLMAFLMFMDNDNTEETDYLFSVTLASIYCSMLVVMRMIMMFDKVSPGGKYFRTVKGGFDTFAKAQVIFIAEGAVAVMTFCAFLAVLDALGIIEMGNGIGSCITLFITVFLARAIASFSRLINKPMTRTVITILVFFTVNMIGIMLIETTNGKLSAVHIVSAAAAVVLTVISEKAVLSNYRKKHWDN